MEELRSPNGELRIGFDLCDDGQDRDVFRRCPMWSVTYRNREVLLPSRLGLELDGIPSLLTHFEIVATERAVRDDTWQTVCGEHAAIRNHYAELIVRLRETVEPRRELSLVFRAYDTGGAVRYAVPDQPRVGLLRIWHEATRFHIPAGCEAWVTTRAQGEYTVRPVPEIGRDCERPLLLRYRSGHWAAVGEALQYDYPRMKFRVDPTRANTLAAQLSGNAWKETPFQSPWRYVIAGDRPVDVLQRNSLPLNLAPPCRIEDTGWIQPGKAIREITLSTEGARRCVDFAAAHGIRYILFDSGWYGHPLDEATDATTVELWEKKLADPDSHGGLDLPRVLDYAKSKGIGVWLYVDQHGLERQLHRIVPLYAEWGVAGIKFGFVHVGTQGWSKWLIDAIALCAEHRLMVDVHDEFRPAGVQRTWPNLVNVEGIRGNEEFPSAGHNVTLPFTRFVDGMADYTVCIYSPRLKRRRTHQLAMAVCYFSPFELLYWYDRPEQFAGEPELAFLDIVPTVWDETRVLDGYPGEFVVIARRAGDEWFLGGMNGESRRDIVIPLGFLHGQLACTVYCDGEGGRNRVEIRRERLGPADALEATLLPSGGLAAHFHKG